MARTAPFEREHQRYENWFTQHAAAYRSELLALRAQLPHGGLGVEIGVGTGRFAGPLGVRMGIDPARPMLRYAAARGITVAQAVAEALPFADAAIDYVLVVTTICFVDDPLRMLHEAHRVLRPGGAICIGLVDRETPLGRAYRAHRADVFYSEAVFYSCAEVEALLARAGFCGAAWVQTLFGPPDGMRKVDAIRPGYGAGTFAAVRALKAAPPPAPAARAAAARTPSATACR